jgi:hypothetical protein
MYDIMLRTCFSASINRILYNIMLRINSEIVHFSWCKHIICSIWMLCIRVHEWCAPFIPSLVKMRICTIEPACSRLFNIRLFAALLCIWNSANLWCRRQWHLPITSPRCCRWPHPLGTLQWPAVACDSAPMAVTSFCCRLTTRLHAGEHYDGAASLSLTNMSLSLMESYGLLFCVCMSEVKPLGSLGWMVVQLSWK